MKSKAVVIAIIAIIVLVAGAFFYWQRKPAVVYKPYQDEDNRLTFEKPETWFASSSDGYVRVSENTADTSKPSILVKLEYPESIIESLGLDKGEMITIGGKNMRRVDIERKVPAAEGTPALTVTYTDLLWESGDDRKIIFEISPWQKPDMDPSVIKFLETFETK